MPDAGVFAGKTDGTGAFDNGDGTITVLINHELTASQGLVRDHGSTGAFVDRLVIDKATLQVVGGDDLIQSVNLWNDTTDEYGGGTTQFDRFCSGDLALPTAFFDAASGLGTNVRIYLTGEESGTDGRAFAIIATGSNAGTAYELPHLGNMSFENAVANPLAQGKTVVAATNDADGGQVYFYVGDKQASGSEVEQAGLFGGDLFGLKVDGIVTEANGIPVSGTFKLEAIGPGGDASNLGGTEIESQSDAAGVTGFLRPEDCAWDPDQPNVLYFATTNSFDGNSRLYQVTFTDITNPELGGTIQAVLDGSEGQHKFDGITVANGKVVLQEDPGDNSHVAKIWEYDIASDHLIQLARFDPAIVTAGGAGFITQNEESSGLLDVSNLLGDSDTRAYLVDAQLHAATGAPSTVEAGQLMVMYVDDGIIAPPPPPLHDLTGTSGNDVLQATDDGNWTVDGLAGNDTITTLGGNDVIIGDAGNDSISAGGGDDIIHFTGTTHGFDTIDGGAGTDRIEAAAKGTVIGLTSVTGVETISANGFGSVSIKGSAGNDVLDFTNVTLTGIVLINAGAGNDSVSGSAAADLIVAGAGADTFRGNGGADRFLFDKLTASRVSAPDKILDFQQGSDKIDLHNIDAKTTLTGNQAFSFIGEAGFGNNAGELRIDHTDPANTLILGDVNGDGVADFAIHVAGNVPMTVGDFIL